MSASLNETSTEIFTEKAFLQGALLCGVAYGAVVPLYLMTSWLLWKKLSSPHSDRKRTYAFLAFSATLFILATLSYACNAQFTQLSFIDNRNMEGGPAMYEETMFSIPIDELGNVCEILSTWMCDALLVWRFYTVYNQIKVPAFAIMLLPALLWLGSVATGILFLLQVSANSPWVDGGSINWTIPFFSLSLSLNIIITIAIVLRLLLFRRQIVLLLGRDHGTQYTSIAAMIVESAAIFSTFSLLFLVPFALNHPLNEVFFQALNGVQVIATLLIMFRVAQGKGWDTETVQQDKLSSIHFGSPSTPGRAGGRRVGVTKRPLDTRNDMAYVDFEASGTSSTPTVFASVHSIKPASDDKQFGASGIEIEMETLRAEDKA
ncbi:hypothetical protein BC629DRAFT_1678765 [Irpex lacteus]|nr:hypothetical protein BC629DRAFT_1678765 [Irpex lacteus]